MFPSRKTPLAWSNLVHNKVKLFGALSGVTFAVTLMFMEMGFRNALLDGTVGLLRTLDADLVLVPRSSYTMGFKQTFPRQRLYEAAQFDEVASASPLYIETARAAWRNPISGLRRPIRVVGFRPGDAIFLDPAVQRWVEALNAPDTALFDQRGKSHVFGAGAREFKAELVGRPVHVIGSFGLGADFVNDGNLLMTDRNFAHYFGGHLGSDPDRLPVDLGLIKVRGGYDPAVVARVQAQITRVLPPSVTLHTKDELITAEKTFWLTSTPIGFVFTMGLVMGFVVGTIICYQILFSDITSYLREYATLLAMGYPRRFLVKIVLEEAVYLALLGFACGTLAALGIYAIAEDRTRLPFNLDWGRVLLILVATLAMCIVSACFAIQKLWRAAPAELF
ncbi:MAG: ABC transporter permease DevC [Isosphaeraceae bacterium]|nr:ABC transporter permease DevC [Isosphaeraceae bacterium]